MVLGLGHLRKASIEGQRSQNLEVKWEWKLERAKREHANQGKAERLSSGSLAGDNLGIGKRPV